MGGVAKSFLPPGAFALYSHLAKQEGGVTGFLGNLQGKDLQGVIDEVKNVGGDDAKRIIEKIEKKLKAACAYVTHHLLGVDLAFLGFAPQPRLGGIGGESSLLGSLLELIDQRVDICWCGYNDQRGPGASDTE